MKGLAEIPQALLPLFKVYDIRLNLSEIHILSYFFRIRLFIADLFKYRLCGLSLCIQQDSFLFNFVLSCRFCLSAFHSSNSRIPSSLLKKSMIAGINARASESISYCGIPVLFFFLAIPRSYVFCSIRFPPF